MYNIAGSVALYYSNLGGNASMYILFIFNYCTNLGINGSRHCPVGLQACAFYIYPYMSLTPRVMPR